MTEVPSPSPPAVTDRPPRRRVRWALMAAVLGLAVLGSLVLGVGGDDAGDGSAEALALPVTTVDGGSTTLQQLTGPPMVVNFFASWCPPCRAEMPELEQVHQERGGAVRMVGVSVDYDTTTWKSLVAESGITFETVFEPTQDLLRAVGGKGMPTTVLVDGDGYIAHVHTGPLDATALHRMIDERLGAEGT